MGLECESCENYESTLSEFLIIYLNRSKHQTLLNAFCYIAFCLLYRALLFSLSHKSQEVEMELSKRGMTNIRGNTFV